jgi:GTP-binding protein Era
VEELGDLFTRLGKLAKPVFLVVNKVDLVEKPELLPLIDRYAGSFAFKEVFPLSALRRDETGPLLDAVVRELPFHPPYYPVDTLSDQNERFFVAEIIREKVFLKTHEEVPYATSVTIIEFKEREGGKWYIGAEVYVERDSQRGILIGKNGVMLKEIGTIARREIERFLGHPVFLELHVKVRDRWRSDEEWVKRLGYRT